MIRIEDPTRFPEAEWNVTSSKERALVNPETQKYIMKLSSPCKLILENEEPLLIAGVFRASLLDPPLFWALFTERFTRVSTSALRVLKRIQFPSCMTYVEQGNERAERLAKHFGFTPCEGGVILGDTMYDAYRRAE